MDHIVYISCKPTSLVRDLEVFLENGYRVDKAVAVDQFPWTANVETVVLLSKEWSIGPFSWGKDAKEAVHNAVVLEEVAKMAYRIELIHPQVAPAPQELQDKHYFRKHGANAYYGQN